MTVYYDSVVMSSFLNLLLANVLRYIMHKSYTTSISKEYVAIRVRESLHKEVSVERLIQGLYKTNKPLEEQAPQILMFSAARGPYVAS